MVHMTGEEMMFGRVKNGEKTVVLTRHETAIFHLINTAEEPGCTMKTIADYVFEDHDKPSKTFSVHMFNLRKKLTPLGLTIVYNPTFESYKLTEKS